MPDSRWWKNRPGIWEPALEDALASDSDRRVGLAWAVIMLTGGKASGCRAAFHRITGVSESALSNGLSGLSFGPKQIARITKSSKLRDDLFEGGNHPLSVRVDYIGRVIEPGDALWRGVWEIVATERPDALTPAELEQSFPDLFPDVT